MRTIYLTMAVLMIALLVASCGQEEQPQTLTTAPFFTTVDEAIAAVGSDDKNILVDFYTDW